MSVTGRVQAMMDAAEWDYWYAGQARRARPARRRRAAA